MVCFDRTPILGRVGNLPIHPSFGLHVAQVLDNHIRHPQGDMFVTALAQRTCFGLPKALVQAKSPVIKLFAVAAVGIAVRVHLAQIRKRLGSVVAQLVVRLLDRRFVGRTHGRRWEKALLLERLAQFHNHLGLIVLETAALLATVRFPPTGARFIEWLDRTERESPFRLEM